MLKTKKLFVALLAGITILTGCQTGEIPTTEMTDKYNVVWDAPSDDHNGSMPLGNGDVGLNIWVENNGDICFFIGKTDSWGEDGRLLKVGKVRIKCEPSIVTPGMQFKQELDLKSGTVEISSEGEFEGKQTDLKFSIWVDANNPVVNVDYKSSIPLKVTARTEPWRTQTYELNDAVFSDLMQSHSNVNKTREPVIIQPDVVESTANKEIVWYHHNNTSQGFSYTNKLQGVSDFVMPDPMLNRTFGALLKARNVSEVTSTSVETRPAKSGSVSVFVLTKHPSQPEEWKKEMEQLKAETESVSFDKRKEAHHVWWANFWNRSWINAADVNPNNANSDAFNVSRAYTLQRFIDAGAGRGAHPIKFNGSIFTVTPKEGTPAGDPDYRRWGPGYWWQNTRLPYLSMCAAGDYDLMQPLFKMYAGEAFEVCKKRTEKYFGFDGAYFPECIYFWGAQFAVDYGPKPWNEREDKLQDSRYHKWEWVSGLELVFMMQDYYDYSQDEVFLTEKIIPVANEVIRFFDNYYKTDENGKMVMYPSQALETWWDCTNPMPELAGLYSITNRLIALPENVTKQQDRQFWNSVKAKLSDIPTHETSFGTALAPAERFEQKRNVENAELYSVFPFRLFGVGNPNLEWGLNALENRWDKGDFGWRQDDIFMAYLGLTDQAKSNLVARAKNFNKESRFPAFWGPNYDWTPDQDHGGVLMKTFQSMVMQADPYSQKIYLFPAWPKDWDVDFKLHAPHNTTIEATLKKGEVVSLKVTPESRRKDVQILNVISK
ncbi:DUF5703 domain-containing protein [Prolixibacteraceae bacterium Z1-6]|uniref:DUF5703 domain-containing protein n=1 Tax=Draconibacterium aestuarii TaxID=2998507 RepID=A0A9X3F2G7_9BACT|nr:DUF5703 domain-containing protein [Prolixibacteraceae bacterium Z1-6]